mmetsp:Transcript_8426/g.26393  ORF Transcript_8426/g.26393 Transcript_8426/m.26393 type:complete len:429 (+) Transcript_8426:2984-4270(+)
MPYCLRSTRKKRSGSLRRRHLNMYSPLRSAGTGAHCLLFCDTDRHCSVSVQSMSVWHVARDCCQNTSCMQSCTSVCSESSMSLAAAILAAHPDLASSAALRTATSASAATVAGTTPSGEQASANTLVSTPVNCSRVIGLAVARQHCVACSCLLQQGSAFHASVLYASPQALVVSVCVTSVNCSADVMNSRQPENASEPATLSTRHSGSKPLSYSDSSSTAASAASKSGSTVFLIASASHVSCCFVNPEKEPRSSPAEFVMSVKLIVQPASKCCSSGPICIVEPSTGLYTETKLISVSKLSSTPGGTAFSAASTAGSAVRFAVCEGSTCPRLERRRSSVRTPSFNSIEVKNSSSGRGTGGSTLGLGPSKCSGKVGGVKPVHENVKYVVPRSIRSAICFLVAEDTWCSCGDGVTPGGGTVLDPPSEHTLP